MVLLISVGFSEKSVWCMDLDQLSEYTVAAKKVEGVTRSGVLMDTMVAISSVFSSKKQAKKLKKYIDNLLE